MTQLSEIRELLASLKPELMRKYHVQHIGLFGSVVRDDFTPDSDIDIIVDFSRPVGMEFIKLGDFLEDQFNRKVDLISSNGIQEHYWKVIEPQIIYV